MLKDYQNFVPTPLFCEYSAPTESGIYTLLSAK